MISNLLVANDVVKKISDLEEREKSAEGAAVCREWLKDNPGDPDYFIILKKYIFLEEDVWRITEEVPDFIKGLTKDVHRGEIYFLMGELLEMLMDKSMARRYFSKASLVNWVGKYEAVLNSGRLLYELGFYEDAIKEVRRIPEKGEKAQIDLVLGRYLVSGMVYRKLKQPERAEKFFQWILKYYPDTKYSPLLLLHYSDLLNQQERVGEAEKLLTILKDMYGDSPEYRAFKEKGALVSFLFSPNTLFTSTKTTGQAKDTPKENEPVKEGKTVKTSPFPFEKAAVYIQTGSFRMEENALDLIKVLKEKGVSGKLREKVVNEITYLTVVVEVPGEKEPKVFLEELKNNGFDGFVVR